MADQHGDDREQSAWAAFLELWRQLSSRLERQFLGSNVSCADYRVLAPAAHSHQGEPGAEVVAREDCADDAQGTLVRLTDAGHDAIRRAAPGHLEWVRTHFIDLFSPDELDTLTAPSKRVVANSTTNHTDLRLGRRTVSRNVDWNARQSATGSSLESTRQRGHLTDDAHRGARDSFTGPPSRGMLWPAPRKTLRCADGDCRCSTWQTIASPLDNRQHADHVSPQRRAAAATWQSRRWSERCVASGRELRLCQQWH